MMSIRARMAQEIDHYREIYGSDPAFLIMGLDTFLQFQYSVRCKLPPQSIVFLGALIVVDPDPLKTARISAAGSPVEEALRASQ